MAKCQPVRCYSFCSKIICVYFFDIQTNVQVLARNTGSVTVLLVLVRVSRDGMTKTAASFTATTSTTVPVMERA